MITRWVLLQEYTFIEVRIYTDLNFHFNSVIIDIILYAYY